MIKLSEILGQETAVRRLQRALAQGKVAHAYLFYGPPGVGKETAAWAFIQSLQCSQRRTPRLPAPHNFPAHEGLSRHFPAPDSTDACGVCSACRQVEDGNHPDVMVVRPQGASLRLAPVKELQRQIAMKMVQGPYKIALITEADRLTPEAGNSLLKTLEEPPAGSVFILISSQAHWLLPTIVSRCQPVYFRPLAAQVVEQGLRARGLEATEARQLAAMGGGSLGRALALAQDEAAGERVQQVLAWARETKDREAEEAAGGPRELPPPTAGNESVGKKGVARAAQAAQRTQVAGATPRTQADKAAPTIQATQWAQALRRAEQWSGRKDLDQLLGLLSNWWYREIVACEKAGQDSGWARQGFMVVTDAIRALDRAANKRLALEVMFLRLLKLEAQRPIRLHEEEPRLEGAQDGSSGWYPV